MAEKVDGCVSPAKGPIAAAETQETGRPKPILTRRGAPLYGTPPYSGSGLGQAECIAYPFVISRLPSSAPISF